MKIRQDLRNKEYLALKISAIGLIGSYLYIIVAMHGTYNGWRFHNLCNYCLMLSHMLDKTLLLCELKKPEKNCDVG